MTHARCKRDGIKPLLHFATAAQPVAAARDARGCALQLAMSITPIPYSARHIPSVLRECGRIQRGNNTRPGRQADKTLRARLLPHVPGPRDDLGQPVLISPQHAARRHNLIAALF